MTITLYLLIGFITAIGMASFICYDEMNRMGKKSLDDIDGWIVPASMAAGLFWPITIAVSSVVLAFALPVILGFYIAGLMLKIKNKA